MLASFDLYYMMQTNIYREIMTQREKKWICLSLSSWLFNPFLVLEVLDAWSELVLMGRSGWCDIVAFLGSDC